MLLLLPPLALWAPGVRRMIGSMYILGPLEIVIAVFLTVMAALSVAVTARLILENAEARFGAGRLHLRGRDRLPSTPLGEDDETARRIQFLLVLLLSVPTIVVIVVASWLDAQQVCDAGGYASIDPVGSIVDCGGWLYGTLVLGAVVGLLAGVLVLWLMERFGRRFGGASEDSTGLVDWIDRWILSAPLRLALWAARLCRAEEVFATIVGNDGGLPRVRGGHRAPLARLLISLAGYGFVFLLLWPREGETPYGCIALGEVDACFPTVGFLLIVLMVLGWLLPLIGYLLDKLFASVVAVCGVLLLVLLSPAAHYYAIHDVGEASCPQVRAPERAPLAEGGEAAAEDEPRAPVATPAAVATALEAPEALKRRLALPQPSATAGPRRPIPRPSPSPTPVDRPVVVVAAQGGGILAAAWTAEVLTRLEGDRTPLVEEDEDDTVGAAFTARLGAVSSVSGGSLGAVQYLADFDGGQPRAPETLKAVRKAAAAPGLRATGWGTAYPDGLVGLRGLLTRGLGAISGLVPSARCGQRRAQLVDRAWALEQAWLRALRTARREAKVAPEAQHGLWLSQWRERVGGGSLPVPLINATTVGGGAPFVIAPIRLGEDAPGVSARSRRSTLQERRPFAGYRTFQQAYGTADIHLLTAARLSATFPYVSPIARPLQDAGPASHGLRLADGGYYDNQGIATLSEWLESVLREGDGPTRVLLVNILLDDCGARQADEHGAAGTCRAADEHRELSAKVYAKNGVLRGGPRGAETVAGACRLPVGETLEQMAHDVQHGQPPGRGAVDAGAVWSLPDLPPSSGYRDTILGPFSVLMSARTAVQHVRNDQALSNLHRRWQDAAQQAASDSGGDRFEQLAPMGTRGSPFDALTCVSFVYQGETPLSWQLSPGQRLKLPTWWHDRYLKGESGDVSPEVLTVRRWLSWAP